MVIRKGEESPGVFLIITGRILAFRKHPSQAVRLFEKGDDFGDFCLLEKRSKLYYQCEKNAVCLFIPYQTLKSIFKNFNEDGVFLRRRANLRMNFLENLRKEAKEKETMISNQPSLVRDSSHRVLKPENSAVSIGLNSSKMAPQKPKGNAVMPLSMKKPLEIEPTIRKETLDRPKLDSPTSEDNRHPFLDQNKGWSPTSKDSPDLLLRPKETLTINDILQQPHMNELGKEQREDALEEPTKALNPSKSSPSDVKNKNSFGVLPPLVPIQPKQTAIRHSKPLKNARHMTKIGPLPKKFHGRGKISS